MPESFTRHEPLSAEGERRREAMLGKLLEEMARHHHARRRRRRLGAATGLAALLIACGVIVTRLQPGAPPPASPEAGTFVEQRESERAPARTAHRDEPSPEDTSPWRRIEVVETDPAVLDRYTADDPPRHRTRIERIGDAQLLADLRAAGRPMGLVRAPDRIMLTDPETGEIAYEIER